MTTLTIVFILSWQLLAGIVVGIEIWLKKTSINEYYGLYDSYVKKSVEHYNKVSFKNPKVSLILAAACVLMFGTDILKLTEISNWYWLWMIPHVYISFKVLTADYWVYKRAKSIVKEQEAAQ